MENRYFENFKHYFNKYLKDKTKEEFFWSEIKSVFNNAFKEFQYLKESKIDWEHKYKETIKRLERNKTELQRYSKDIIHMQYPKHPSSIAFLAVNYLYNQYSISEADTKIVIDEMYKDFFESKVTKIHTKANKEFRDNMLSTCCKIMETVNAIPLEEQKRITKELFKAQKESQQFEL